MLYTGSVAGDKHLHTSSNGFGLRRIVERLLQKKNAKCPGPLTELRTIRASKTILLWVSVQVRRLLLWHRTQSCADSQTWLHTIAPTGYGIGVLSHSDCEPNSLQPRTVEPLLVLATT